MELLAPQHFADVNLRDLRHRLATVTIVGCYTLQGNIRERRNLMGFKRVELLDITKPEHGVQVQIRKDGTVLWVHVDGITVLRICQIPRLDIEDGSR